LLWIVMIEMKIIVYKMTKVWYNILLWRKYEFIK